MSESIRSYLKCSPDDLRNPNVSVTNRLSKEELRYTLEDLLSSRLSTSRTTEILNQLIPQIDLIPKDNPIEGMSQTDQSVSAAHVEQYFVIADLLASQIAGRPADLDMFVGCTPINSENCYTQFIDDFGSKVLRRPLDDEDRTFYRSVFEESQGQDGYRNLMTALLSSPRFIYHFEFGDQFVPADDDLSTVELDPFERASRLSYFLLRSLPDDELMEAARNGSLMNAAGLAIQVDRLLQLEKVRTRWSRSFADQWLDLEETPLLDSGNPAVDTMLSELNVNESPENRRQHMIDEVVDYFYYMIWVRDAQFREFMTSDLVFPRTADLAEIYNSEIWNGGYQADDLVRSPANERAGVLTRAQVLYTGSQSTRPIMRGVGVYRNFLCEDLELPANNAPPMGLSLEDHFSAREVVQTMTEQPGTACAGCHQTIINPLAFPFENYDSFGSFRTQENIFHPRGSAQDGDVLTTKPVDSSTSVDIGNLLNVDVSGPVELVENLAESDRAELCFDQKVVSFAIKQNVKLGNGYDCAVQGVFMERLSRGGTLMESIRAIVMQPEFMKRTQQ